MYEVVSVSERIREYVRSAPGCTQLEISRALFGPSATQQRVNGIIATLVAAGQLARDNSSRPSRYHIGEVQVASQEFPRNIFGTDVIALSEDEIKVVLRDWLLAEGWSVVVAMGTERGIDIEAHKGDARWIIEVKGPGSRQPMRVNYFIAMLGEVLQRMNDPKARYSIALPDLAQFRGLWNRLPALAKERTTIDAIFVNPEGRIDFAS